MQKANLCVQYILAIPREPNAEFFRKIFQRHFIRPDAIDQKMNLLGQKNECANHLVNRILVYEARGGDEKDFI